MRAAGIDAPILLLSQPTPTAMPEVVGASLTPTVYTPSGLQALAEAVRGVAWTGAFSVHVKVDTGMHRVGAGPGDAGLLTVRGAELLARAAVIVYDALVNKELLRLAPQEAELIYAGKRSNDHAIPQAQLNQLLVEKARAGLCVVRLKGGDPYVFGRGGEEAEELAAAGVAFEVVPGVTSSIAGPNYAGIPLTHRDFCSTPTRKGRRSIGPKSPKPPAPRSC